MWAGGEVGMRLTGEMIQEDDKRFKRKNLLAEFNYCGKEVPKRNSITNDDIRFYAWLCRSAYALLKEQEKQLKDPDRINVTRCKDCKYATMTSDGRLCKYCELVTDDDGCEVQVYYDANWYCGSAERVSE